ncbi:metallophosphoesterase [Myxococcota bacterium]|nr:metallophosphoesterase [Myxococcota bacterium]MBU1429395.1 metallophosphoesterase [Myxococcota bacterium]MBU1896887.1 metallophosphoesterase [Myxococcota bacterium]
MIRLAHFSDPHVLSPRVVAPHHLLNKRWLGGANLLLRRRRHHRVEIFQRLLDAIKALDVDHTLCTGDMVNLALETEFERAAKMIQAAFKPDQLTIVPGNHDRYVAAARGAFERHFGAYLPQDIPKSDGVWGYPVVRLLDGVCLIGLCSAVPRGLLSAAGLIGEGQLEAMKALINHPSAQARFRIVMLHHPVMEGEAKRELEDAAALEAALRAAPPELVVHGHNHRFMRQALPEAGVPVLQVASASYTSAKGEAEFNVYEIDDGALRVIRWRHDPIARRFEPIP